MHIWVTDDKRKVPVLIRSEVAIGAIKIVLRDAVVVDLEDEGSSLLVEDVRRGPGRDRPGVHGPRRHPPGSPSPARRHRHLQGNG